jgi:hypothetical protein
MRIRIIKSPPAPLMDGFDVRDMVEDQIREVDSRTANYLVIAGYGVRIRANDDYPHDRNRGVPRTQQTSNPRPENDFRDAPDRNRNVIPQEPPGNGRASHSLELSRPGAGTRQEQSRPEEAADKRQIAEPREE